MREIGRLVLVLVAICVVAGGGLAAVRGALAERIERQGDFYVRGPALERLLGQPAKELLANKVKMTMDGQELPVFFVKKDGALTSLAVEAAGTGGYGGDILIMIGVDLNAGAMLGMEVIAHSETPGVGSNIAKEGFRAQWKGLPFTKPVALGEGLDAISGATYSSRAVTDGTNRIIQLLAEHRDEVLAAIEAQGAVGEEGKP